ncbi:hypothetical protein ScPMuIL_013182 [Solemya velum]
MAQWEKTKEGNMTIYKKRFPKINSESVQEFIRQIDNVQEGDRKIIGHARSFAANVQQGNNLELHIILDFTKVEAILTSGDCANRVLIHLDSQQMATHIWEKKGFGKLVLDGIAYLFQKAFETAISAIIDKIAATSIASAQKKMIEWFS